MEHVNIADGNDRVTIQAGQIITITDAREQTNFTDGVAIQVGEVIRAEDAEDAAHTGPDTDPEVRVFNVRSGNARVGMQADTVIGSIHIRW